MSYVALLAYGTPLALIWGWYVGRRRHAERSHIEVRERNASSGLAEPASLHPVIDATRCIGQTELELHRTLEIYGHELEFLVATDPEVRQGLLSRMRPARGRGAKALAEAPSVRQLLSTASPALKARLSQ